MFRIIRRTRKIDGDAGAAGPAGSVRGLHPGLIQQEARGTDTERYLQSDRNSSLKGFLRIFSMEHAGDAYLKGGRHPVFREKCGEKCKKM